MSEAPTLAPAVRPVSVAEVELRAALARAGGCLTVGDQIGWGEALLRQGDAASARVLLESAYIRQGCSRQHKAARRPFLEAMGASGDRLPDALGSRPGVNTVELAIAELSEFARTFAAPIAAGLRSRPTREYGNPGLHPTAVQTRAAVMPSDGSVSALVNDLFGWLSSVSPDAAADQRAAAAIEMVQGSGDDSGEMTAFAGAPADVLASAVALRALRSFLRANADLLEGPFGSLDLFRAAAALDSAGLGPWFGNVGRIVRRSADLFELAAIAEESAATAGIAVGEDVWVVLITRALDGSQWDDLVDELGDRDAALALDLILTRELTRPAAEIDQQRIMRLRDMALDNLRYDLAATAQRALVTLYPGDLLELRILGTIDASAGFVTAAEQSFLTCLAADPTDLVLRREIEANRARRYAPHALGQGFGSPRDRQLYRLHRRARAAEARARG